MFRSQREALCQSSRRLSAPEQQPNSFVMAHPECISTTARPNSVSPAERVYERFCTPEGGATRLRPDFGHKNGPVSARSGVCFACFKARKERSWTCGNKRRRGLRSLGTRDGYGAGNQDLCHDGIYAKRKRSDTHQQPKDGALRSERTDRNRPTVR